MKATQMLLSCDWGTSAFRLTLVRIPDLKSLCEIDNGEGIAHVYSLWNESGLPGEERIAFYQRKLLAGIQELQRQFGKNLHGIPLVISGMASSSIGMLELPYTALPCPADGAGIQVHQVGQSAQFCHDTFIISGVRSKNDVMRGEETQVAGSYLANINNQIIILPGTHSKHVTINQGIINGLKTYMTGELFAMLSKQSILANSVTSTTLHAGNNENWFLKGLVDSKTTNPLNAFFTVRTNQLFSTCTKQENYMYLSGLCIGLELLDIAHQSYTVITLVSGEHLKPLYQLALQTLLPKQVIEFVPVNIAVIKGQFAVLNTLISLHEILSLKK